MQKNNVIEEITSLINKCNGNLEQTINNSSFHTIVSKIINLSTLSEEEITLYEEEINKIYNSLTDEEILSLDFLNKYLINKRIPLASNQESVLTKIESSMSMRTDIETAKKLLDKNKELASKLDDGTHLDLDIIEQIRFFLFDELEALSIEDIKLSPLELNRIIFDLIDYNMHNSNIKTEKVTEKKQNNSLLDDSELLDVLAKYGYDYNFLDEDEKLYLRRYADIDNIDKLLSCMKDEHITLKLSNSENKDLSSKVIKQVNMIFTRILVNSDVDIIEDIKNKFSGSSFSYALYIMENPGVIIGNNRKKRTRGATVNSGIRDDEDFVPSCNDNFKENYKLFMDLGFDFDYLMTTIPTIFLKSYESVRENYFLLSDVYDIKFDSPKPKSLSVLANSPGTTVSYIDRYIESSPMGYEYIKNNPTKINLFDDLGIYQIRVLGEKIFYTNGKRGLIKYTSKNSKVEPSMHTILKYKLEEIQPIFDPNFDSEGNYEPRIAVDSETKLKLDTIFTGSGFISNYDDERVLSNPCVSYLESNCRVNEDNKAYPYLYNINGTLISRKKVLRMYGQLIVSDTLDTFIDALSEEEIIKYIISYNSLLNEQDVKNINNVVNEMIKVKTKKLNGGI